ncbi:serine/arginine repetitive matrix protein 1-like [Haemorhous mexicanus]|uniref:serine/arginine repetitive matrix protein 1-like n=1 Tax=Haemorhous mexicanus TaxID=30427 RepID=UPI0028BEAC43|nr:serine/arginine repetitive matrix protein 1-like [Haemorhous mexicanus]
MAAAAGPGEPPPLPAPSGPRRRRGSPPPSAPELREGTAGARRGSHGPRAAGALVRPRAVPTRDRDRDRDRDTHLPRLQPRREPRVGTPPGLRDRTGRDGTGSFRETRSPARGGSPEEALLPSRRRQNPPVSAPKNAARGRICPTRLGRAAAGFPGIFIPPHGELDLSRILDGNIKDIAQECQGFSSAAAEIRILKGVYGAPFPSDQTKLENPVGSDTLKTPRSWRIPKNLPGR